MSAWNGNGGAGGSPEFVHVDAITGSSSTSGTTGMISTHASDLPLLIKHW
jgi:hypothetical protein